MYNATCHVAERALDLTERVGLVAGGPSGFEGSAVDEHTVATNYHVTHANQCPNSLRRGTVCASGIHSIHEY